MKKLFFASLLVPVLFVSCTRKDVPAAAVTASVHPTATPTASETPDEVVKKFVSLSASAQEDGDRKKLESLCAGPMRSAFERMTPEAFRMAYINTNLKIKSIEIVDSKKETNSARIHYRVTVDNTQGGNPAEEINEREVELTWSDLEKRWVIGSLTPKGSDKLAFKKGMIF